MVNVCILIFDTWYLVNTALTLLLFLSPPHTLPLILSLYVYIRLYLPPRISLCISISLRISQYLSIILSKSLHFSLNISPLISLPPLPTFPPLQFKQPQSKHRNSREDFMTRWIPLICGWAWTNWFAGYYYHHYFVVDILLLWRHRYIATMTSYNMRSSPLRHSHYTIDIALSTLRHSNCNIAIASLTVLIGIASSTLRHHGLRIEWPLLNYQLKQGNPPILRNIHYVI